MNLLNTCTCQDFQAFSPEDSDDLYCEITIIKTNYCTVYKIMFHLFSKYQVAFPNSYIKLKLQYFKRIIKQKLRQNQ